MPNHVENHIEYSGDARQRMRRKHLKTSRSRAKAPFFVKGQILSVTNGSSEKPHGTISGSTVHPVGTSVM